MFLYGTEITAVRKADVQKGLSFIELMFALLIGSMVIGTVFQLQINYSESSSINDYQVTAQDNGRLSLYVLSRAVHMAGYQDGLSFESEDLFYSGACEGDTSGCTQDGGGTGSDRLAVLYEPLNGVDCTNASVPANGLTADVYYIAADTNNNNINSLFCRGYDPVTETARAAGVVMVSGVERLQLLYSLVSSTSEDLIQYATADNVTDWDDVRSVRIGVLVGAGQDIRVFANATRTYDLLGSGTLSLTDRLPRYQYSTTARVNNSGL